MKEYAHRGQILPVKNEIIPITKHTTLYASLRNSIEAYDQGRLIKPSGIEKGIYISRDTYIRTELEGLNIEDGMVIEGWVKPENPTANQVLFGFDRNHNPNSRFYVSIYGASWTVASGVNSWSQTNNKPTGDWQHFKIVVSSGNVTLYIDDEFVVTKTHRAESLGRFEIGHNPGPNDNKFVGSMSEFKFSKNGKLICYYPMNEEGIVLFDASSNGYDGIANQRLSTVEGNIIVSVDDAVKIEPASKNIILRDNWGNDSSTVRVVDTDMPGFVNGTTKKRETVSGTGTANMYIQIAHFDSSVVSKVWTLSTYIKRGDGQPVTNVGSVYMYADAVDDGKRINTNQLPDKIEYAGEGWYRVTRTTRLDRDAKIVLAGFSALAKDTDWYINGYQLEPISFASSYMPNGTSRAEGRLAYPIEQVNYTEGTIGFYVKHLFDHPYQTDDFVSEVMTAPTYSASGSLVIMGSNGYNDRLFGIHWGGVNGTSHHTASRTSDAYNFQNGDWNHHLISWHYKEGYSYYVNGRKFSNRVVAVGDKLVPFGQKFIQFKHMHLKDLRIESRRITDKEARLWALGEHYDYMNYNRER